MGARLGVCVDTAFAEPSSVLCTHWPWVIGWVVCLPALRSRLSPIAARTFGTGMNFTYFFGPEGSTGG